MGRIDRKVIALLRPGIIPAKTIKGCNPTSFQI